MEENILEQQGSVEANETMETIGVSEELFIQRMDNMQNHLSVLIIGVGMLIGCVIGAMVMRWFHND